jgi:predicted phosphodiesterase
MRGRDKTLKKHLKKKKSAHLAWTANQLDSLEWEWLESLSDHQLLSVRETRILIVHGSGVADDDYIFPSITAEGLKSKIMGAPPEVLVCGHSHIPFIKVVGGVRVINCGSVGRPVDGDPRGSYVLADFPKPRSFNATIVRFSYPVDALIQDLVGRKVPFAVGDEYLKGIKQRGV